VAGATILRGAADTYIPMLVAAFGYWCIGIPASYVLGFHTRLGAVGVWVGLCIGLAVVALLLAWRVRQVLWGRGRPEGSRPCSSAGRAAGRERGIRPPRPAAPVRS